MVPELIADLAVDQEKSLVLTYAEGADVDRLEARLEEEHGLSFPNYARPNPPGRLVHLDAIGSLLIAVAAFFTLLGVAGLVHALTTSSRRHQVSSPRCAPSDSSASKWSGRSSSAPRTIVGIAAVVGIPVGIVVGRQAWLSVVGGPRDRRHALGARDADRGDGRGRHCRSRLVVAAGPAWRAARRHPAEMLRVE